MCLGLKALNLTPYHRLKVTEDIAGNQDLVLSNII